VKYWFDEVLDLYMECGLVTSFNRKKNKIHMMGEYTWAFKSNEKDLRIDLTRYHKIYTQEQLEKEFKERGWVSPKNTAVANCSQENQPS
jgi:predicted transposase YbfD/YdcC